MALVIVRIRRILFLVEYHEIDEMRELHLREMKAQEHTIVLLQILREVLSERVLIEKRILENGDLSPKRIFE